jgi:hypothetical protein
MELFEPLELRDYRAAWRDRHAPVPLRTRALAKDLGKAGFGGGLFARIVGGGRDQLANDPTRAHDAIIGDTAAMRIPQQESPGLGDPRRVGRNGGTAPAEEKRDGCNNRDRTHGKLPLGLTGKTPAGVGPVPATIERKNRNSRVVSVTF